MKRKNRPTATMEQSRHSRRTLDEGSFLFLLPLTFRKEATSALAGFHAGSLS